VKRFNFGWLVLTLLLVAVVAGLFFGYQWWVNRPEYLYQTADEYYNKGKEAAAADDKEQAKANFESADKLLRTLLKNMAEMARKPEKDKEKKKIFERNYAKALVLHTNVLIPLATLSDPEDRDKLNGEAFNDISQAAQKDPTHAAAQWFLLNEFMSKREFRAALPYASNLIGIKEGDNSDGDWPNYALHQVSANWIMAWNALNTDTPPRVDQALMYLNESKKFDAADLRKNPPADKSVTAKPRWRAVALEVQALVLAAKEPQRQPPAQPQEAIDAGLARAAAEAQLPKLDRNKDQQPRTLTVPWLAIIPSPTDLPGLMSFLGQAIDNARNPRDLLQRSQVAVQVCNRLVGAEGVLPVAYQEVEKFLAQLAIHKKLVQASADQRSADALPPEKWRELRAQIDAVTQLVLKNYTAGNPAHYVSLAENALRRAQKPEDFDQALDIIAKGLKKVKEIRDQLKDPTPAQTKELLAVELELHLRAARAYLVRQDAAKAEAHLAEVRKHPELDKYVGETYYLEGMIARAAGRLEQAIGFLTRARRLSGHHRDLIQPHGALAYAYLGLGRYGEALAHLQEVEKRYRQFNQLSLEEQIVVQQMVPNDHRLSLDIMRCYLALNDEANALKYRDRLKDLPQAQTAAIWLVNYYLEQARKKDPGSDDQRALWTKAQKEIAAARRADNEDPRLVWAECSVILAEPGKKRADQVALCEKLIDSYRQKYASNVEAGLVWVTWLRNRGKIPDALKALKALEAAFPEKDSPKENRRLKMQRAQLAMASGQSAGTADLLKSLGGDKAGVDVQLLEAFLAAVEGKDELAQKQLKKLLDQYPQNALLNYYNGWAAQRRGQWKEAIKFYAASLQFAAFTGLSEIRLVQCINSLSNQESPAVAGQEAFKVLQNNPNDPALLWALAQTAIQLDDIYGKLDLSAPYDQGAHALEGILERLALYLASRKGSEVQGPYLAAQAWLAAGRPDYARRAVATALQMDPKHVPSRVLAVQLAQQDQDWAGSLKHLDVLEKMQVDPVYVLQARATALLNQDKLADAREVYEKLKKDHEIEFAGYRGLALMLETAKDYAGALAQVDKWRDRVDGKPLNHDNDTQMRIRLLARMGKLDQAQKIADDYIKAQVRQLEATQKEQLEKFQGSAEQKKQLQEQSADAVAFRKIGLLLVVADALSAANALDAAEKRIQEALAVAEQRPERGRAAALRGPQLVLGSLYLNRSRSAKGPDKDAYAAKAIAVYNQIRENFPKDTIACNNLVWILNGQKADKSKILPIAELLRKGVHSNKRIGGERLNYNILDTLGVVYRDCGEYKEMLELFKEAVFDRDGKSPGRYYDNPRVLLHLGRAYARSNQTSEADQVLGRARNLATAKAEKASSQAAKAEWEKVAAEARQAIKNP
jgi:hypothetical protein